MSELAFMNEVVTSKSSVQKRAGDPGPLCKVRTAAPMLLLASMVAACQNSGPFESENDWHCAMALRRTMQAAQTAGDQELVESMNFRAAYAVGKAQRLSIPFPSNEQAFRVQEYLESSVKARSKSALACRRRQDSDPEFPKGRVL